MCPYSRALPACHCAKCIHLTVSPHLPTHLVTPVDSLTPSMAIVDPLLVLK